jgi:hypothetical protein
LLKQSERLFFGGAALGNLADMPQHQSARKDSQGCQHRPKGQVNAHESQLTASQPRKEHGFIGSGVEMAHKLRNPGTFSHSCGEASISQLFEARPRFCKSGGICWIKFVACIAGDIHHDLLGHSPRPFVNPYQEQLVNSEPRYSAATAASAMNCDSHFFRRLTFSR